MIENSNTKECFLVGTKKLRHKRMLYLTTLFALLAATAACSGLEQRGEVRNMGHNNSTTPKSSNTSPRVDQPNQASADTVAREIELCPPWDELNKGDDATRGQIMKCLEQIANYDLAVIRQAMEKYMSIKRSQKALDVTAMSRLYVLNRYVFNVPEKASFERSTFGGWMGVPHDSQWINLLWPFSVDEKGKLTLTGQPSGYLGDEYKALQEFDYFNEKYGVRRKANKDP